MAAVLRRHFDPHLAWEAPFVFFVAAILTSARAAGILATLLGVGYDPRDFEHCTAAAEQPGFYRLLPNEGPPAKLDRER